MSYTAAALSFMLENLGKSVVLTGEFKTCFFPNSFGAIMHTTLSTSFLIFLLLQALSCPWPRPGATDSATLSAR